MTFVRANPPGWALFELLTSSQMNILDSQIPYAIDGLDGGAYSPTATIELDGSGITGPTLKLEDGSTFTLDIEANQAGMSGGLRSLAFVDVPAATFYYGGSPLSQAGAPSVMVDVIGHDNSNGAGGIGINVRGGNGGTAGGGGAAVWAIGGIGAVASGEQGAAALVGQGGATDDGSVVNTGEAAGLLALGGNHQAAGAAGHGVVAKGGTSSTPALNGAGGYFLGNQGSAGVVGVAETGFDGPGVVGYGDSYAVQGIGVDNGAGGSFAGEGSGIGLFAVPGASVDTAISAQGSIDFDGASSAKKNPVATLAVNNELYGKSIVKAWGYVVDGVLVDGFNIASVAINGSFSTALDVTMAFAMASTDYSVFCNATRYFGGPLKEYAVNDQDGSAQERTTTKFTVWQYASGSLSAMATSEFSFMVLGAQS